MPKSVGLLRPFISFRAIGALSVTSIGYGLSEALVLVLVARIAFALSKNIHSIDGDVFGLHLSVSIGGAIWLAAGLVLVRCALQVVNGWQSSLIVTSTLARLRKRLARAFLRTSWSVQAQEPPGRLQELLTNFTTTAGNVVDALTKGITSVFSLIAMLGTALLVSPLAAIGFAATAIVLAATLAPLRRVLLRTSRKLASTSLDLAGGVSELSVISREVQVFDTVGPVTDRIDRLVDDNAHATQRQNFLGFLFTPAYTTVMLLLMVVALGLVSLTGVSDLEELSAVILVMLRSLAYGQLAQAVFSTMQSTVPFMENLREQIGTYESEALDRSAIAPAVSGRLECRDVGYRYPSASKSALDRVSFVIDPGELVGIIGPSGSGKSTLVQLLLRLRPPTDGSICLGGVGIDDVSLVEWRSGVTFVPQEPRLIRGTVADNIRFFREIDTAAVEAAARSANIHEEIVSLPDGYDTVLGAHDVHLSGGQQQRVCIARALATDPWMLVLDEPTSALDVFSEARIRDTLAELAGSVSTLVVAHRLSTVQRCDRIMVIQDGRLAAFDTPDALMAEGGFYSEALELSGIQ